jgi:hypothetical protein
VQEDAPYDAHLFLSHDISVSSLIVLEAIVRPRGSEHLAFSGLSQLTAPSTLCYLCPLELGKLIEDAISELPFWASVPAVVHGSDLRAVLLELLLEKVVIGWLAGEAVPVLGEHHIDAASSHEIPYTVHAWPLQAGAALSRVYYLLQDLVSFSGSVLSQGFELLGERVA